MAKTLILCTSVYFLLYGCDSGVTVQDQDNQCGQPIPCTPLDLSNAPPGKIVFSAITEYAVRDSVYNSLRDTFDISYYNQVQLFMINPDGTDLQQITDFDFDVNELMLSPGGSKIAFTSWGPQGVGINTRYIYVYDRSDSSLSRMSDFPLGEPSLLSWSPEGKRVAYVHCVDCEGFGTNNEIFVIDVEAKRIERLTDSQAADTGTSWSPNGKQVVFYSNRDDPVTRKGDLYVVDVQTKAVNRLTCTSESEGIPWWSPQGCQIAYGFQGFLHILELNTKVSTKVIPLGPQTVGPVGGYTAWSPDGKRLARLEGEKRYLSLAKMEQEKRFWQNFPHLPRMSICRSVT